MRFSSKCVSHCCFQLRLADLVLFFSLEEKCPKIFEGNSSETKLLFSATQIASLIKLTIEGGLGSLGLSVKPLHT